MKYTLTYTQEQVRPSGLCALVGRITDEAGNPVFKDEIAYDTDPERLAQTCKNLVPSMTGSHQMQSGESWRTFVLP